MFRRGYTLRTNKEASLDGSFKNGDVAQLGEHRLCKAGVRGSSPLVSTIARFGGLFLCAKLDWRLERLPILLAPEQNVLTANPYTDNYDPKKSGYRLTAIHCLAKN